MDSTGLNLSSIGSAVLAWTLSLLGRSDVDGRLEPIWTPSTRFLGLGLHFTLSPRSRLFEGGTDLRTHASTETQKAASPQSETLFQAINLVAPIRFLSLLDF